MAEHNPADPIITFHGVVAVSFYDEAADFKVGDTVEPTGLTKNTEVNGLPSEIKEVREEGPESLYRIEMRGGNVAVLKKVNIKRCASATVVEAEGAMMDLGKELQLKLMCSKESDLDPVKAALTRALQDTGAAANIVGEWTLKQVEWDDQPMQSKSSFKWIEAGSMLKFRGAVDTTVIPRQAPPQQETACCTVQ
mmetsp:Transcript_18403/g.45191  ORF Transcript_18403/g.45191 Transcript_18403/m.45191 type:complete len:194 (+) Transcript_18403:242-823(+)